MKKLITNPIQLLTHIGALIPLGILVWDLQTGNLGPDIIREATLRTGKTALVLLVLSLACTPIYTIFKYRKVLPLRRPLGLYAFMYASIHFAVFVGLDYGFDLELIKDGLFEKRFALAGLSTGLILLPLALTSTKGWMKRLGKSWKRLHRFVYLAGVLAVVHYIWLVKQGVLQPWFFALILSLLLLLRVKAIKKLFTTSRRKISPS